MDKVFDGIVRMAAALNRENPGDYRDSNGLLVCGDCREPREYDLDVPQIGNTPPRIQRVAIPCRCSGGEDSEAVRKSWSRR